MFFIPKNSLWLNCVILLTSTLQSNASINNFFLNPNSIEELIKLKKYSIEKAEEGYKAALEAWKNESCSDRIENAVLKISGALLTGFGTLSLAAYALQKIDEKTIVALEEQIKQRAEIEAYAHSHGVQLAPHEMDLLIPSNSYATKFRLFWKEAFALSVSAITALATFKLLYSAWNDISALQKPHAPDYHNYLEPIKIVQEEHLHSHCSHNITEVKFKQLNHPLRNQSRYLNQGTPPAPKPHDFPLPPH